jgi:hypothetical protein
MADTPAWKDARSERYAVRIADCALLGDLRILLGSIIAADLPESDFTTIFAQVIARRAAITKKSADEIWDRLSG